MPGGTLNARINAGSLNQYPQENYDDQSHVSGPGGVLDCAIPGVWRHGDWASIDEDGFWFLHGRSDDTINVAGRRIGPAEIESILVSDPAVVEAAVVGIPTR